MISEDGNVHNQGKVCNEKDLGLRFDEFLTFENHLGQPHYVYGTTFIHQPRQGQLHTSRQGTSQTPHRVCAVSLVTSKVDGHRCHRKCAAQSNKTDTRVKEHDIQTAACRT